MNRRQLLAALTGSTAAAMFPQAYAQEAGFIAQRIALGAAIEGGTFWPEEQDVTVTAAEQTEDRPPGQLAAHNDVSRFSQSAQT